MISEAVKIILGLQETGIHNGNSFILNCETLLWPISEGQPVYVTDYDGRPFDGRPMPEGMYRIFTTWKIGLKIHKEMRVSEEALMDEGMREVIKKELLLSSEQ